MCRKKYSVLVLVISLFLFFITYISITLALEVKTHELINKRIAFGSFDNFSFNGYLVNQIGINTGVNELFNNKAVYTWLMDGGRYEDEPSWTIPYLRSVNHYHNPLTEQGFSGYFFGLLLSGDSSVVWAQKPLGTQGPGGYYSWNDVRDYFYKALTATNKRNRENNFAETFRGLGQLMHLIQDASVPAHTRNDAHFMGYEKFVRNNINIDTIAPTFFDSSILNRPTSGLPIANVFDTNRYSGSNPEMAVANNIGLTEYTNANFFSEDTINSKSFPYPRIDSSTPIVDRPYLNIFGQPYFRKYYLKNCCGETDAGQGYLLSAVDYLDSWRLNFPILSLGLSKIPVLDDNVYGEYTKFLIRRAIGYSSGLLKYFFRGKLHVTAVPILYKNTIYYLRVKIKNMTPNETMIGGIFTLTYSYRPAGGNPDGSQDIWGQSPVVASGILEYGGDDQHPVEDTVVDFWLPIPIPRENYDSAKFTLAFKGTLGNEGGAVIGKALTLGEVKFEEEWNNGLSGNHNWAHTGINLLGQNPDNGSTSNVPIGDTLVKDNIRYVGRKTARVNESYVGYDTLNNQFLDILPIRITPDTYIQFKIDEMWINQRTPAPPGYTNDWQHLLLRFNNGLGIQYTTQGQGVYLGSKWGNFEFDPNLIIVDNIYELFEAAGITIPPGDLYLRNIAFIQQLSILSENSAMEHHQHMKIDSIRIIEGKKHE